jgi:hypothetical protein
MHVPQAVEERVNSNILTFCVHTYMYTYITNVYTYIRIHIHMHMHMSRRQWKSASTATFLRPNLVSFFFNTSSLPALTLLIYVCVCVYMYVCMYVYVCVCVYIYIYMCMYVCMYACMYACMHVCMWKAEEDACFFFVTLLTSIQV